jgi:hypothetical protein
MSKNSSTDVIRIKALLHLHTPKMRKLDSCVASLVWGWDEVQLANNKLGDWVGHPPEGELQIVPNYSTSEILAWEIVTHFSGNSLLKTRTVNPMPKMKAKMEHEAHYGNYFCWEYHSPKSGKRVHMAWAVRPTMEEAICSASVDVAIFLTRMDKWYNRKTRFDPIEMVISPLREP